MFWLHFISNNISLYRDTSEAIYRYVYTLYGCNSTVYLNTSLLSHSLQTVRVMVAGSSLLHKAHLYEVMAHLQQEVDK